MSKKPQKRKSPARARNPVLRERLRLRRELARGARLERQIRRTERAIARDIERQRDGAIELARLMLRGSGYQVVEQDHWERTIDELEACRGRLELLEREREEATRGENASLRRDVPQGEASHV